MKNLFINITPLGAYYAVSTEKRTPLTEVLRYLLKLSDSPQFDHHFVDRCEQLIGNEDLVRLLKKAQKYKLINQLNLPEQFIPMPLEQLLIEILPSFTASKHALLADDQGFCLGATGFKAEQTDRIAALSADISIINQKHSDLLENQFSLENNSWLLVNHTRSQQMSFWPFYIKNQRFILVILGQPTLVQPKLVDLLKQLSKLYS